MSNQSLINLAYLTASMLFIMAFKLMTGPRTAVRGNYLGAAGMAIAILAACFEKPVVLSLTDNGAWPLVMLGIAGVIGGVISFGLIGIFVGPVALAVTYTLLRAWMAEPSALIDRD